MRSKVILTYPQYTGIFLNKESKRALMRRINDNIIQPIHQKKFGHHVTVEFNPGGTQKIKWGAKVELLILKHIYDQYCQIIEVKPIRLTYKDGDFSKTVTDYDKILELLNTDKSNFYITISTQKEEKTGHKITYEYSDWLLATALNKENSEESKDITCVDLQKYNLELTGFCGMYGNAIIETMSRHYYNKK